MTGGKERKLYSKKKIILSFILLGVPIIFIVIGSVIIGTFGWEMTKETALLSKSVIVPYKPDESEREFKTKAWSKLPEPGSQLGNLTIPSLDLRYPVVQGTHENELKRGIGHMAGSTLPGQGGHVILSGHRDTVFKKLEHLKVGDEITFKTPYGDFIYEATDFKIVDAKDESVAVPTNYETLTLTTCYPFEYIGNAPERYIVYTKLKSNPLENS